MKKRQHLSLLHESWKDSVGKVSTECLRSLLVKKAVPLSSNLHRLLLAVLVCFSVSLIYVVGCTAASKKDPGNGKNDRGVVKPNDRRDIPFAVYAERSMVIRQGARVKGGAVGAPGSRLQRDRNSGPQVRILGARISGDVYGETVLLDRGARVWNVYTNELIARKARYRAVFPLPSGLPDFPGAPAVAPDQDHLIVPPRSRMALVGSPNSVVVGEGASLILQGGEYKIEELRMAKKSRIVALRPSRLFISQLLETEAHTYIGPGRGRRRLNLHIVVAGEDVHEVPRASIGPRSRVLALLTVPNGTLMMKNDVKAAGAYFARDVDIGIRASIEHYPGLKLYSDQCLIPYCEINGAAGGTIKWNCQLVPLKAGSPCDDGNACTTGDACNGLGLCIPGSPVPDPDPFNEDPCIRDTCNPVAGIYEPAGTICDTEVQCRQPTMCNGTGSCVELGELLPAGSPCDDGIPNNGDDTCTAQGSCFGSLGPFDCLANNCSPAPGAPPNLECWFNEHPSIKTALRWIAPLPPNSSTPLLWDQWEPWRKQQLQQALNDAWAWYDSGMTTFQGTFIPEPPPNKKILLDDDFAVTVFDETTVAWHLYLAHVAQSLLVEIKGLVPWSLCNYPYLWELFELLQAHSFYWLPLSSFPDYTVTGTVTPAHPTVTFAFMVQNGLIGSTRLETIANVLNWARRMQHFIGPFTTKNAEDHWQYRGLPPESRIIEGTIVNPNVYPGFPDPEHWTRGCWGTSGFLKEVLRAVNIPVRYVSVPNPACPHATPHFLSEGLYLSHGDDPYISFWREGNTSVVPPMEDFLIDQATYSSWFEGDPNEACNNIGRRPIELMVDWLPDLLVENYCDDVANNETHASGSVYQVFQNWYTVQELEAENLWSRLSQRACDLNLWCCGM